MSDRYRFYCPNLAAGEVTLPDDQAHHAVNVLRLEVAAEVEVFDGAGGMAVAKVTAAGKRGVMVQLLGELTVSPPPMPDLTLATAAPKGDRLEWLVEQASQLNVARIILLDCDRSVVKPKESGGKIEKLRRLAIESAKQCGRNHVLKVEPMRTLKALLADTSLADTTVLALDPRAAASASQVVSPTGSFLALIGPEGGWSDGELNLLATSPQIQRVRLTPTVLRIETACAAIAALCGCSSAVA